MKKNMYKKRRWHEVTVNKVELKRAGGIMVVKVRPRIDRYVWIGKDEKTLLGVGKSQGIEK